MKLAHRLGYYFFGFIIGLFLLFFFLGGKKASCDYSPNARVLKNIRTKKRVFSNKAAITMKKYNIDSVAISSILESGNVNFSKSDTKQDSCNTYTIEGMYNDKKIALLIANCNSTANISRLDVQ